MRVALHTRVRTDRIAAYEAAHREVPAGPAAAVRGAGVREWTTRRSGADHFPPLDVDEGAGAPPPVVWQL
ncbi:hypothetical protein PV392_14490 [Streptomyces sp. ME03-5709C]|nr:hypothetical protein [Streptomyces sp. ME03-5709C]